MDNKVYEVIQNWTLKEKVGQLFILAFPGKQAEEIKPMIEEYNVGGCYLSQDNAETFEEARKLNKGLDKILKDNNRLPLLLGVDQEGAWGVLVDESTTGPGNLALGVNDETENTKLMYEVFGKEMRSAGFNCILGPCCDINFNPKSPIIDTRSFGDRTEKVSNHSVAAVKGLYEGGIISCAKHFPGHGDTHGDTHRCIPEVGKDLETLIKQDLAPFQAVINAGVDLIMTSHILYPHIDNKYPATLSKIILQDILRKQMNFDGIIISDSMNMGAIVNYYTPVEAAVKAIKAGINMIMLSEEHYDHSSSYVDKQLAMINGIIDAVENGELDENIIDKALEKVVQFKLKKLLPMKLYENIQFDESKRVAEKCALNGVSWIRGEKVLTSEPVYLVNATPENSYSNLMNPRGIGPNQSRGGYFYFADELKQNHKNVIEVSFDELPNNTTNQIIVVTENHPLPGEDFEQEEAQKIVNKILSMNDETIVVALRSPYDLLSYGNVKNYLCSHSPRPESAVNAVKVLLGDEEGSKGVSVNLVK